MKNLPIKIKKTLRLKYRQTFKTTEFILKERKTRYQTRIFSFKKISSPSRWWYQLVWHGIGQPNHFLSMDEEWKWMQKHTSDMYRKNFYLPFNAFINIKIGFCTKQCSITRFEPRTRFFYNKHSIHVLSKHMNGPPRHLTAIPSITIFGIKWKKKYMKIDLTSRLKTRQNWGSRSKEYGNYLQSTRDSKSNQTVRRSIYQNDLWLRFIRTLILYLYNFKFLILSVLVFNTKTFCVHKLIKKDKKTQNNHWRQRLNK